MPEEGELARVEASLAAAARALGAAPVPRHRLQAVQAHVRYAFLLSLASPAAVAEALVPFAALTGGVEAAETFFATLAALTPGDVQDAAAALLRPERSTVAVLRGQP